jgi:hypothetical protein
MQTTINGIEVRTISEVTTLLSTVYAGSWTYSETVGEAIFVSSDNQMDIIFSYDAEGRLTGVEMVGYRNARKGFRPGMFRVVVEYVNGRPVVKNVHNDAFRTESGTKVFKAFRAAAVAVANSQM